MLDSLLLDAILLIYFLFVLFMIRIASRKEYNEEYLSADNTTALRGIMAIGIVLHHMSERVTGGYLFPQMVHAGYLLVSTFFFLSGYGLIVQYQKRGETYLNGFLRKRLLYLVIVYLLDVGLYALYDLMMGKTHSFLEILQSVYRGGIAKSAWYMIVLIFFYVCFWLIFRFLPQVSTKVKILVIFFCQIAFIGFCLLTQKSGIWYISNFGFSLGMYWACEKEWIDTLAKRRYWLLLAITILLFTLFSALPLAFARLPGASAYAKPFKTICRLISTPISSILLVLLLMKVRFCGRIWTFLGKISLEIYLLHGMAYSFLRSDIVYLENEALWVLCTVAVSILIAIPANLLNRWIAKTCRSGLISAKREKA